MKKITLRLLARVASRIADAAISIEEWCEAKLPSTSGTHVPSPYAGQAQPFDYEDYIASAEMHAAQQQMQAFAEYLRHLHDGIIVATWKENGK